MKIIAVIPARYGSQRFPGKSLALLNRKYIIQHVYENARDSNLFDDIIIATDNKKIFQAVKTFNGKAVMTSSHHNSGTDRVAEVCVQINFDIVVNIQGDEPFLNSQPLIELIQTFNDPQVEIASLMHEFDHDIDNPNYVKVITDKDEYAIYFSRSRIPYNRDNITAMMEFYIRIFFSNFQCWVHVTE